jgi:uncharacterized protein (DUF2141 family)
MDRNRIGKSREPGNGVNLRSRLTPRRLGSIWAVLVLLLIGPSIRVGAQSGTATLRIRVTGVRNNKGRIALALFQSEAGFPGDSSKAVRLQPAEIDAQTRSAQFVLERVPYGVYAVSVFHDENMNGKLDKNFVGAPKEGYGASNNPRKRMGPPPFDEAKFSLDQPEQSIEIKLIY